MTMTTTETPRIWIADLAAYNNGVLHGRWVDATDAAELTEAKDQILASSPEPGAEEWAIHDYDGFGSDLTYKLGEYASFDTIAKLGALIEEYGDEFLAYVSAVEPAPEDIDERSFQEARRGAWDSEADWARDRVESLGYEGVQPGEYVPKDDRGWSSSDGAIDVIDLLLNHLDLDMVARDCSANGEVDFATVNGTVYAFDPNAGR
jgi:antirestriction protein